MRAGFGFGEEEAAAVDADAGTGCLVAPLLLLVAMISSVSTSQGCFVISLWAMECSIRISHLSLPWKAAVLLEVLTEVLSILEVHALICIEVRGREITLVTDLAEDDVLVGSVDHAVIIQVTVTDIAITVII